MTRLCEYSTESSGTKAKNSCQRVPPRLSLYHHSLCLLTSTARTRGCPFPWHGTSDKKTKGQNVGLAGIGAIRPGRLNEGEAVVMSLSSGPPVATRPPLTATSTAVSLSGQHSVSCHCVCFAMESRQGGVPHTYTPLRSAWHDTTSPKILLSQTHNKY